MCATRGAVRSSMEVCDRMQSQQLHLGNIRNEAGKTNHWARKCAEVQCPEGGVILGAESAVS